jgi:hypothetical protein
MEKEKKKSKIFKLVFILKLIGISLFKSPLALMIISTVYSFLWPVVILFSLLQIKTAKPIKNTFKFTYKKLLKSIFLLLVGVLLVTWLQFFLYP